MEKGCKVATIIFHLCFVYLGASPAVPIAPSIGKHLLASPSRTPSRCSAHRRSLCPVCGSATVAIIPLQARFVPLCAFRSINAPSIAFPVLQASSAVSTSCLSRQPHKACCCHSPLRSLTGVANANELPQLLLRSAA